MSTTPFSTFLTEVLPYCPDAMDIVAINAVRNACIQFCEETHWLESTIANINGAASQASYPIPMPAWAELVRLTAAYYDQLPLIAKSEDQLRSMYTQDWRTMAGLPRFYLRDPDNAPNITVAPYPELSEVGALAVVAVLKPTRAATMVDTTVYAKWCEQIAAGAVARLMLTPGQAYSNPRLAPEYQRRFRVGIGDAKIDRNRSKERASLVMRPPVFF